MEKLLRSPKSELLFQNRGIMRQLILKSDWKVLFKRFAVRLSSRFQLTQRVIPSTLKFGKNWKTYFNRNAPLLALQCFDQTLNYAINRKSSPKLPLTKVGLRQEETLRWSRKYWLTCNTDCRSEKQVFTINQISTMHTNLASLTALCHSESSDFTLSQHHRNW